MADRFIRVLLAEDSPTVRRHLISILAESADLRVIAEARDGEEVVQLTEMLRPDVISMDIKMPQMDGLEATRRIMTKTPTPIVVVTGLLEIDLELSFRALEAGALAVVEKPPDRMSRDFADKQRHLIKTLQAMAGVRVISRRRIPRMKGDSKEVPALTSAQLNGRAKPELIAIGASTGGPSALSKLLSQLPANLPVPVVIVQHMAHEFIDGLARWLDNESPLEVKVARDGDSLEAGVVHLSPGTAHLTVSRRGTGLIVRLLREQGAYRYQPSIDVLFQSVAQTCGLAGAGIVLTGMGEDGADGLLAMRQLGAWTFAQDKASSIVFGMPNAAIERGAVESVVSLSQLPTEILKII